MKISSFLKGKDSKVNENTPFVININMNILAKENFWAFSITVLSPLISFPPCLLSCPFSFPSFSFSFFSYLTPSCFPFSFPYFPLFLNLPWKQAPTNAEKESTDHFNTLKVFHAVLPFPNRHMTRAWALSQAGILKTYCEEWLTIGGKKMNYYTINAVKKKIRSL